MKTAVDETAPIVHPNIEEVLVIDLETDSLDTNTAQIKFAGCYSYKYRKYYIIFQHELHYFYKLFEEHKIIVGFNIKNFDLPIILKHGIDTTYKIVVDCLKVLYDHDRRKENRSLIIELKDGRTLQDSVKNYKLKTVCEALDIETKKGDIDYRIFQKPNNALTKSELNDICIYLYKDIRATKELFEFYIKYFESFKEYVPESNIKKFNYIRSSLASYTYEAICHMCNLEPVYADEEEREKHEKSYIGGYVREPIVGEHKNNILCFDFSSLYPNIYIQAGLFGHSCTCCTDKEKWTGDAFFDIKGKYCSKKPGIIENLLKNIYLKRAHLKRNKDPRQLALKLIMNSLYGITASSIFKTLYHPHVAEDCTSIGRKMIHYVMERFEENGVVVLYGDTDSVFIQFPENKTKEDMLILADKIVSEIQTHLPFPW